MKTLNLQKVDLEEQTICHLNITTYIEQIKLDLAQDLEVFQFKSLAAQVNALSFLWSLSTLIPN